MKLAYAVKKEMGDKVKEIGIFTGIGKAREYAIKSLETSKSDNCSFSVTEFPLNKEVMGGILIVYFDKTDDEIFTREKNPVYSYGGIKKWARDYKKQKR